MHTSSARHNSPQASQQSASAFELAAVSPGQLRVIKRNGTLVPYTDDKISIAITKAFLDVEGGTAAASSRVHETVQRLTAQISATFRRRMPSGGSLHIEEIQDQVELELMRAGEHKVAREYVIYREAHAAARRQREAEVKAHAEAQESAPLLYVTAGVCKRYWPKPVPVLPRWMLG